MNIKIPPYVCSKEYCTSKISSLSFIYNLKDDMYYVLYGSTSVLWNFIINSQNYNEVLSFAHEHNLHNILNDFLSGLKARELIQTDSVSPAFNKKYFQYAINKKSDNFEFFIKYKEALIANLRILNELRLCLNYTCNLNCKHCCNPKNLFDKMSFTQAKNIIDEAVGLGVSYVTLSGGECTINKDFLKIAEYVRNNFLELGILTNAQQLYNNPSLLYDVISIYPSNIQISLYSMNPNIHDNLTGVKGSHYKSLYVIKKLKEHNINVTISCFQTSYNSNSHKEVKSFADSIGCGYVTDCRFEYNPANNNLNAKLSECDIEKFYLDTIDIKLPRKNNLYCSAGYDRIEVMPNLNINPCTYCYYFLGNYKNISLTEIRNTTVQKFHRLLNKKNLKDCFKHEYCNYCQYCPVFTCYEKDGFLKKNEILCEDAKIYYKVFLNKQNGASVQ